MIFGVRLMDLKLLKRRGVLTLADNVLQIGLVPQLKLTNMKIKDLAKEYALNNTDKLDDSREYMITVISESYKAGFEKALSLFAVSGSLLIKCNVDCPDFELGNCCHPTNCQKDVVSQ